MVPWKKVIYENFIDGARNCRYLSSFNGSFDEELIGVDTAGIDGDYYNVQIGDVFDAYELLKSKINSIDVTDIFELSRIVLETVNEYFGGFDNIANRKNYYHHSGYDYENKNNKISNLKGTGAAMCVERAALAQNLLKSLGINSFYKISGIIKDNNRQVHSYNIIEYNDKYYIFDSSIPNLINGEVNPLIAEIDKETFTLLSSPIEEIGISTTVTL